MKAVARSKADQNEAAVDPWTLVHLSSGLAMGLMAVPLRWALLSAAAYEVIEQLVEREEWGQEMFESSGPETALNALADVAVFAVGHWFGSRWNRTPR